MLSCRELPAKDVADVVALVRALGGHRYVSGRLVLVHAAVFAATEGVASDPTSAALLDEGRAWAREILASKDIEPASRDERLHRRSTEKEAAAAIEALWSVQSARDALARWLDAMELPAGGAEPFDEEVEDDIHPILIDAGWELLPLGGLDDARHAGAIGAFGERITFESARFEEADLVPPAVYLQELSAFGPVELLRGVGPSGLLARPPALFTSGHDVYQDYVIRGVLRAARLA